MIERADKVAKKLEKLRRISKRRNNVGVIVGYTAKYALWVHENREIWPPGMRLEGELRGGERGKGKRPKKGYKGRYWDPQGRAQPKFLEEPFRQHQEAMVDIITATVKSQGFFSGGAGLDAGLMVAGLALQRLSQELVPVKDANLKNSAFTRLIVDNKGKG